MRRLLLCMAILTGVALPQSARADSQDFELYKLGNPAANADANENFRIFANQLGVAVSSVNLAPPETLGHSAFNFALEYSAANIQTTNKTAYDIWPRAGDPGTDMLLMPSAHIRKGLGYSFEVGTRISYLQYSRMTAATAELKWALNEGFFYLPDLGVRGHATRLLGSRDFGLTTAGVDIGIGKQFAIGGMATLTPYAGWDLLYVNATSNVIDFDPDRPASEAQSPKATENTGVFDQVMITDNHNNRFYFGLRFISYIFEVGGEFSITKSYGNKQILSFATKLGLDF